MRLPQQTTLLSGVWSGTGGRQWRRWFMGSRTREERIVDGITDEISIDNGDGYIYNYSPARKSGFKVKRAAVPGFGRYDPDEEQEWTEEERVVCGGRDCVSYIVKAPNSSFVMMRRIIDINTGCRMRIENLFPNGTIAFEMEVTELKLDPFDESIFQVPQDITIKEMRA